MTRAEVIEGLRYIADSPAREHGGFHPNAVATAKGALALLAPDLAAHGTLAQQLCDGSIINPNYRAWQFLSERSRERWRRVAALAVQVLKSEPPL